MVDDDEASRPAIFRRLVDAALEENEIQAAVQRDGAPSLDVLRQAADAQRDQIMAQAAAAELEYRAAVTTAQAWAFRVRTRSRAALAGGIVLVLLLVAVGVVVGWNEALTDAYQTNPAGDIQVGKIVLYGAVSPFAWAVLAAMAGYLLRWIVMLLGLAIRRDRPGAALQELRWIVWVPAAALGTLVSFGGANIVWRVVWQLDHNQPYPATTSPQPWWEWLITAGIAIVYIAAIRAVVHYILADEPVDEVPGLLPESVRAEKLREWQAVLRDALLAFLRAYISEHIVRRFGTMLQLPNHATGLRQVRGQTSHVRTPADEQLEIIAAGMGSGSIALSGPRGVGKTELLDQFCLRDPRQAGLVVSVPVVFDRREFMLHLFAQACELAAANGVAPELARTRIEWIQFLQTRSMETTAGLGWRGFTLGRKRAVSKVRQPLTYPEIVTALRTFLSQAAEEFSQRGRRLVIGIDELDRLEPLDRVRDFLNEVKAVFEVPHCLFLLSVSDEALQQADLARPGQRDAFDSAVDEVIRVEPLTYRYAVRLLDSRAIGIPEPFLALFHCLAGGSPRDLLRTARAAATQVSSGRRRSLAEITEYLIDRDLGRGTVRQEDRAFHDTVRRIFTDDLPQDRLVRAADPAFPGSFDALAGHRRGLADEAVTPDSITAIHRAWQIP